MSLFSQVMLVNIWNKNAKFLNSLYDKNQIFIFIVIYILNILIW